MDPSLDLVDHFRLETESLPGVFRHKKSRFDRSRGLKRVEIVKRWTRKHMVGKGGYGMVWLEIEDDGSKRAVKEVSKSMCLKMELDYKKELATMAKLSRHNEFFVDFFGWFEIDDTIFLAMEYFELGDLGRHLTEDIPERQIKIIMVQLLEGLKIMHQNNFTHRDLKPQNIFVLAKDPVWWVKIGDFGITKRITNDNTFLRTEIGTREYLAPEVIGYIDEDVSIYTNAVDIWSLGCICHQLLTHRLPFASWRELAPYCWDRSKLPIENMRQDDVDQDTVDFTKGLLAAQPSKRLDTTSALDSTWLKDIGDEENDIDAIPVATSTEERPSQQEKSPSNLDTSERVPHTSMYRPINEGSHKEKPSTGSSIAVLNKGTAGKPMLARPPIEGQTGKQASDQSSRDPAINRPVGGGVRKKRLSTGMTLGYDEVGTTKEPTLPRPPINGQIEQDPVLEMLAKTARGAPKASKKPQPHPKVESATPTHIKEGKEAAVQRPGPVNKVNSPNKENKPDMPDLPFKYPGEVDSSSAGNESKQPDHQPKDPVVRKDPRFGSREYIWIQLFHDPKWRLQICDREYEHMRQYAKMAPGFAADMSIAEASFAKWELQNPLWRIRMSEAEFEEVRRSVVESQEREKKRPERGDPLEARWDQLMRSRRRSAERAERQKSQSAAVNGGLGARPPAPQVDPTKSEPSGRFSFRKLFGRKP